MKRTFCIHINHLIKKASQTESKYKYFIVFILIDTISKLPSMDTRLEYSLHSQQLKSQHLIYYNSRPSYNDTKFQMYEYVFVYVCVCSCLNELCNVRFVLFFFFCYCFSFNKYDWMSEFVSGWLLLFKMLVCVYVFHLVLIIFFVLFYCVWFVYLYD